MRVVVLGGFGNFGARICRALANDPGIEVVPAGRTDRGDNSARLDLASSDFPERLKTLVPGVVIHCAGPFQGQDYRVAEAAIAAGAHYIDLADGRDFVVRFAGSLDTAARKAGRLAVSGASTLPALSSAVIDVLSKRFRQIEGVQIVIAPGQRAPRGTATIASVFSYAGRPFQWLSGGVWSNAWGWQELRRVRFAGFGTRWAAACDVPDLELLPERYPGVKAVEFRAALELGIQHFAFWTVAALRRIGVPVPVERWAAQLNRAASWLDAFGSEKGGMLVALAGTRGDSSRARIEWHLTAEASHGPEIPAMAAILLARKLARGELAARGAFPCMGLLTLSEFEAEFAKWRISTVIEETAA
ncbi:MAG TPA: saccharopine dehydrogenase NADP-binding domain-containing protein [Burkholderiales bacterium]|nr:saccharopine dehydrogenase NADP-binding domain-containing protein [Burkholderiales bacterium]